jgi:hypothetical protein
MRRAVVAIIVGGLAFGGLGTGLGQQRGIFGTSLTADARPAITSARLEAAATGASKALSGLARKAGHKTVTKIISYDGLEVSVPASWPVYRLNQDPHQCVRYDQNAVYLGAPGANQDCPAGLIGRKDTISIAGPATSPSVDATYGTDPALVEQALATIRQIKPQPAPLDRPKGKRKTPTRTPTPKPKPIPKPIPKPKPTPTRAPTPTPANPGQAGFDTCTAPSLTTLEAWRAMYSATAIYIGGEMMACDYGNLSASWVEQAEAMGWSLMPTFVGLQAPCDDFSGTIDPTQAAAEGTAAASQAVANAASFGLGAGTPVYYDMEGYDHTNAGCRTAVLTFLDAWDRQLTAMGYVSGVYSSADSAIIDLQSTTEIAGHALAEPQAIWFAFWDNSTDLSGLPYLNASVWPVPDRSKQYAGSQTVTVGGISLNIDEDWVASAVAAG